MILRTTTGRSFKGVGKYVLHDKGAQSDERVSFIETENLAFSDGKRAIAEMVHTAVHQKDLKRRAGLRATQNSKPVYHYSLSWDTSENPSLKEQMDAARESLQALGLGDRQALIVGHTDTDNPHVHVVVNLVCPTTGKTASLSNDQIKLSKWAQQYRKERGQEHLCPQRAKNNDRRAKGEFVKADNMTRQEYEAWKKSQTKDIWDAFRADKAKAKKIHEGRYDALWRQKEERFAQRKDEIKAVFKPQWRDLFKKQRTALKNFDAGFFDRLGFALTRKDKSKILGVVLALANDSLLRDEFILKQERERKELGHLHKSRVRDASREVTKAWKYDLASLKASHEAAVQHSYDEAKSKSAEVWQTPAPEQSRDDFESTADRRKDRKKRRSIDDATREQLGTEKVREIQKAARKRTRRERKRKRDRGGRELDR